MPEQKTTSWHSTPERERSRAFRCRLLANGIWELQGLDSNGEWRPCQDWERQWCIDIFTAMNGAKLEAMQTVNGPTPSNR